MDPVRTEVMRNRFLAIAEEASNVAYRTAYTTFVKQTQDYQVALANIDGAFFAYPVRSGVTSSVCQNVRGLADEIGLDRLVPGDIIITNDPFTGDALCTHTMDIHLLRPVFRDGRVIALAWAFIHASDIGGSVAGSIAPSNHEVFQEGIRLRPSLLYRAGVLNEALWHVFADNSRIPDLIWGDIQAMLSGLVLLDRRTHELCDRYGTAELLDSVADVIALSELTARRAIATLTPGRYAFSDYLESIRDDGEIFIHAAMTVHGDTLSMDFTGSDPQVRQSINFTTGGRPHPFLCMPIVNYIHTVEPDVPMTGGIIRPITTMAPRGTLMNATFPAAMGNRWVAVMRLYDCILGCLQQAAPGGIAAAGSGQVGIISVAATDERTGRRHVSVVEPFAGGSGGRRDADGIDGIDQPTAFLRSAPVEVVETETDLVIGCFRFEPGSAAAGRHRGGYGMRIELTNLGLPAIVTVRGLDRFELQPWGVDGGGCGRSARVTRNPDTPAAADIGKIDVLELGRGETLRMITPSGGGFGDPFARCVALVGDEVADGLLTAEQARQAYGVVLVDGAIDAEATAGVRAMARAPSSAFSLGPARLAIEAVWPAAARAALATAALRAPDGVRGHALLALRNMLTAGPHPVTEAAVHSAAEQYFGGSRGGYSSSSSS